MDTPVYRFFSLLVQKAAGLLGVPRARADSPETLVEESSVPVEFPQVSPDKSRGDNNDSDSESSYCEYDDPDYEYTQPEQILERHDDHWDEIIDYTSPWKEWTQPGESWWDTRISRPEESWSNDQIYASPFTQHWLSKLSDLRQSDLKTLQPPPSSVRRDFPLPQIPLFKDEATGDEYQISMYLRHHLVNVWCPAISELQPAALERHYPIYQVRYRYPLSSGDQAPPPPKFVVPLGSLSIRTTARYPSLYGSEEPLTESTDYSVVIDAESEAMPVWLLCSRRQLQERVEEEGWYIPQLPIFGGGMQNEDFGYDAACIFASVRQIGSHPSFQAACELVSQTRAVVDPGVLMGLDLNTKMKEIEAELSVSGTIKAVSSAEEEGASPVQHLQEGEAASPGAPR